MRPGCDTVGLIITDQQLAKITIQGILTKIEHSDVIQALVDTHLHKINKEMLVKNHEATPWGGWTTCTTKRSLKVFLTGGTKLNLEKFSLELKEKFEIKFRITPSTIIRVLIDEFLSSSV